MGDINQTIYDGPPTERRHHHRYKASDSLFAALRNQGEKVGPVFDISRGGLSFRYIDDGAAQRGADRIDLFAPPLRLFLQGIPVRTVRDLPVENDNPFSSVQLRQRGLQFLRIDAVRRDLLERLLAACTTTVAS